LTADNYSVQYSLWQDLARQQKLRPRGEGDVKMVQSLECRFRSIICHQLLPPPIGWYWDF